MKRAALLLICFFVFDLCFSLGPEKVSLVVVQMDPKSSVNHLQHLVSYQFVDGKNVSKDTLLSIPTTRKDVKGSYVRFDIGVNRIYRDRYIVTGIGNIIDIKNKKLLLDQKDQFVRFSGDSVIFYTNDIFKGKYYSVYDLKKETYTKIESLVYKAILGGSIEVDYSAKPYKIWLYDINDKRELLVEDAGDVDVKGKNQNLVPYFWISENSFIYAKTSASSGTSIYKISTDKKEELIGKLEPVQDFANAGFYIDEEGTICFVSPKARYKVDITKKAISKIAFIPAGNKFYVELDENPQLGRRIKDNDREVGKYYCNYSNVKTTDKLLALSYEMAVFNERFPQGVMLWNRDLNTWKKLDIPDVSSIIGWIKYE
jgi:hypothetical protein